MEPFVDRRSDEALLVATASGDPEAFAVFYERHVAVVAAWFVKRTGVSELAADLTGETFAAALQGCRRFRPGGPPALAWLLGIAHNKLRDSARRRRVVTRARERLGIPRLEFTDEDLERLEELDARGSQALELLGRLPRAQRDAIQGRIVDDLQYADLAERMRCSEQVVRQHVSRGLRRLRTQLQEHTDE